MSVDALTIVSQKAAENVNGRLLERHVQATLSASYPNAGAAKGYSFPVLLSTQYGQCGIRQLTSVDLEGTNTAGIAYQINWDYQAGKIHLFTAGQEPVDGTNLSALTLLLKLTGTR